MTTDAFVRHQFKPGQSGNPSGRPKGSKGLAAKIREHTRDGEELLEILLGIARNGSAEDKDRIAASKELLLRGFGDALIVDDGDGDTMVTHSVTIVRKEAKA